MPSTDPSSSMLERIFGTDKERFTKGIKIRRLTKEAGLPEDYGKQIFEGMPVMGMTKYVKAGVPNVAKRIAGTELYKKGMRALGMDKVGEEFAKRYPRISAHIGPYIESNKDVAGRTNVGDAFKYGQEMMPVGLNPKATANLAGTMAHEGTHVAQRLGMGSKMPDVYTAADRAVGYELNPLEESARRVATRYVHGRNLKPFKTDKALSRIVEGMPAGDPDRITIAQSVLRRRK